MGLSILTLARTLPVHVRGGMEEVSWKLAKALARSGVEETILTTATEGTERIWEEDGVVVHELAYVPPRLQGKPWYRWWPYFAGAVARYSRRLASPPDLIHSQSFYSEGISKQPRHPPVVLTVHGTALGDYRGVTKDKLVREVGPFHPRVLYQRLAVRRRVTTERKELARAAAIVPVSTIVAGMLSGVRPQDPRVKVLPNGIDPADFPVIGRDAARQALDLPSDAKVLLFMGRVDEYKGPRLLLDVLRHIPDALLVVAGDGPYLDTLRTTLPGHPAEYRVRILGRIPNSVRPVLYAAADLFCLPSRSEGQPVSLIESMAMGTPVGTTKPWVPDSLRPFATIDQDVERMVRSGLALSEQVDRTELRRKVLSEFTWDSIARAYREVFERVISRGASSS